MLNFLPGEPPVFETLVFEDGPLLGPMPEDLRPLLTPPALLTLCEFGLTLDFVVVLSLFPEVRAACLLTELASILTPLFAAGPFEVCCLVAFESEFLLTCDPGKALLPITSVDFLTVIGCSELEALLFESVLALGVDLGFHAQDVAARRRSSERCK